MTHSIASSPSGSTPPAWRPRWAVSTIGDPSANLTEWMQLCAEWSIDELELRTLSGSLDLPKILGATYSSPEAWAAWLRDQPAQVAVLSTNLRLAVDNPHERTALLAHVPWAEAAGIRWLRVFDHIGPLRPWTDDEWTSAISQYRWWREQRAQHAWRVDLIIEAHQFLFSPENYKRFADESKETPALIFDVGHAVRGLGPAPAIEAWHALEPHAPRIHFKDLSPPNPEGIKHCLPGTGIAPLDRFWEAFATTTPRSLTFEWERQWEPRLPPLVDALTALRKRRWL
ncbi:MAG TPA: hypothetical protein VIO38_05405 [Rariglobus sp.]